MSGRTEGVRKNTASLGLFNDHALPTQGAKISGGVATDQRHDSAHKHVSGTAVYIDDMEPAGTLHGCLDRSYARHHQHGPVGGARRRQASSTC
jgi:xanthine dehydrogenase molybdopterin-binding subunit B